ncbi:4-alpha-glucanotransferase [Chromatiaceae bacterium AAb-1]|nr:4-alpha-glucanotransferase [Chromatiaceae bacterium AAb-1]
MEQIKQLASLAGLQDSYVHAQGHTEMISLPRQQNILAAMGFALNSTQQIEQQNIQLTEQRWLETLAPVTVCPQHQPLQIRLHQNQQHAVSNWQWHIITEDQQTFSGDITLAVNNIAEQYQASQGLILAFDLILPVELPEGYHQLTLSNGQHEFQQQLIITPSRCFQLHDKAVLHKTFGPAIQLYALKSERNWGIGDFTDLKNMVAPLAEQGVDFIGLNPLHALYPGLPQDCSPYSPNSRLWLNTLYVALEQTPEFAECTAARQKMASDEFQQQLQSCRQQEYVDYPAVSALKQSIASLLYQHFKQQHLAQNTPRAQQFRQFLTDSDSSLQQLALYQVMQDVFFHQDWQMAAWQNFPEAYRHPSSPAVQAFAAEHASAIEQQLYLQWLAQQQLAEVQQLCLQQGMAIGLYCDVAVGTSRSSAESWAAPEDYLMDLSVGAPADIMAPKGQNWGLLAYNPQTLRQKAYQPFIRLLQANMRNAGALRLDHVMALLRLWCCPIGADATEGAYIRFPAEDLFAILALESQRNHCLIIGEDLGTVPVEISHLMQQYQVLSYRVFMLEQKESSYQHTDHTYPALSLATVTTHDMPTLIGYWKQHDLALRHQLDLFPDAQIAEQLYQLRAGEKHIMQQALHLTDGDFQQLIRASHLYVAASPARLMAFQLEDLLYMETPVNIPGTSHEYPNWKRRLTIDIEQLLQQTDIRTLLAEIRHSRNGTQTI